MSPKNTLSLLLSSLLLSLFPMGVSFAEGQQKTFSFVDSPVAATQSTSIQSGATVVPVASTKKTLLLNAGTRVPITIYNTVNSNNLKSGDMIGITVNKDIYIDDVKVFGKGNSGVLFVSDSVKSGGHGKPGRLEVSGGRITDLYGTDHSINLSISNKGESKRAGAIISSILGVLVILIPFGLWIDGKPATLQGGSQYDALTTSPSEVVMSR